MLDEVVISANKIPELRNKISQQVHIISTAQINKLNSQTTADLLANSGTIAIQKSQQGGGSPQIRGFEASRIVLVVDGVRMNNPIYRAGHLQNIITLDNNSLERAEILFGPSSTVYGSDALGGVIHLTTKDPVLSKDANINLGGNAMFRYGSANNEKTSHVELNIAKQRFGSFSSFGFSKFGNLKMGKRINPAFGESFGLRNYYVTRSADNTYDILVRNEDPYTQKFSDYSQYDIVQKFVLKPSATMSHRLNLQFSTSTNVPRYDRLTDHEGSGLRNAEWYYGPQTRFMSAYDFSINRESKIADAIHTTLSYQSIRESRHTRKFNSPEKLNQAETVNVWSLTTDLQKTVTLHKIRYGLDAQFSRVESNAFNVNVVTNELRSGPTRYPDGGNYMYNYALYATHTHDLNDQFTFNNGVRIGVSKLKAEFSDKSFFPFPFDEVKQRNTYASGNMGLVFRPNSEWKLSVAGSTGYRVPNIDDLGKVFDTQAGESLIVPNPDIKPEKTINIDLGITAYIAEKVRWENTVFYTFFFDAIVLDAFTFAGESEIYFDGQLTRVLANQNKRAAYITGVSSVLHGDLSNSFSIDGALNLTRGRIKTEGGDSPLDHIPPTFGTLRLDYHTKTFQCEVFMNFSGWKKIEDYSLNSEDNEIYATSEGTPSWYTLNFRFGYKINSFFTVQAGIDNVLDLQYRTFSSGINAPGRNVFGTVRVSL